MGGGREVKALAQAAVTLKAGAGGSAAAGGVRLRNARQALAAHAAAVAKAGAAIDEFHRQISHISEAKQPEEGDRP